MQNNAGNIKNCNSSQLSIPNAMRLLCTLYCADHNTHQDFRAQIYGKILHLPLDHKMQNIVGYFPEKCLTVMKAKHIATYMIHWKWHTGSLTVPSIFTAMWQQWHYRVHHVTAVTFLNTTLLVCWCSTLTKVCIVYSITQIRPPGDSALLWGCRGPWVRESCNITVDIFGLGSILLTESCFQIPVVRSHSNFTNYWGPWLLSHGGLLTGYLHHGVFISQ